MIRTADDLVSISYEQDGKQYIIQMDLDGALKLSAIIEHQVAAYRADQKTATHSGSPLLN